MARLAATDFGADWILNADADEFWHRARRRASKELFAAVPARFGAVRGAWRNFVPAPGRRAALRGAHDRAALHAELPSAPAQHALQVGAPRARRRAHRPRQPRGARGRSRRAPRLVPDRDPPLPRALARAVPTQVRHAVRRARAERGEGDPRAHGRGVRGVPRRPARRVLRAARRRRRGARRRASRTARTRSTPGCATRCAARVRRRRRRRAARERAPPRPRSRRRPLFAGEYTSLGEADLGASFGDADRRPRGIASAGSSGAPPRASAASPEACVRERARRPAAGVRPDAEGRARPLRARARASSGSRRSAGRWRRAGTPGTTSSTTSSSSTPTRRSRRCSSSATPLTPLVVGLPMAIGGSALLEIVFGVLFAVAVVAWSATALTFGRVPALASAVLLLVYPGLGDALPPGVERRRLRDRPRALGARARADAAAAERRGVRRARRSASRSLVLIRPANQVLLPAVLVPLLAAAPWRRRLTWVAVCLAAAVLPLAGWAVAQRRSATTTPPSRAAAGPGCRSCSVWLGRPDDRAGERRLRRGGSRDLIEHARPDARSRSRASTSRSTRTSRTARTTRPSG